MGTDALTVSDLVSLARVAGYDVTARQVERWHKKGLLPRRRQLHVSGLRGSEGRYPSQVRTQFLTLCQIHKSRRMLDEAGFWLWWLGYDVKPGWGKRTLLKHLGPPEPTPANGGDLDPLDVVEQQADELLSGTPASGLVRDLSHRLHHQQDDVRAVLEALLLAALGDRPEWTTRAMREELDEPSLQTLVMKGLGWPADLTAGWRQAFPHLDGTEEAVPLIFDFMTALRIWDLSGMRTFAADLPDSDFARMRDVLRMVSERARQEVTVGLFSFEDHGVYAIRASVLFLLLFIFSAYTVAWSCSMAEGRGKPEQARNQDILRRMRMCIRCVSMKLRSPEVWSSPEPSFRA